MFFFSSRRRHTRWNCDWSSDVCSSDLPALVGAAVQLCGDGRAGSGAGPDDRDTHREPRAARSAQALAARRCLRRVGRTAGEGGRGKSGAVRGHDESGSAADVRGRGARAGDSPVRFCRGAARRAAEGGVGALAAGSADIPFAGSAGRAARARPRGGAGDPQGLGSYEHNSRTVPRDPGTRGRERDLAPAPSRDAAGAGPGDRSHEGHHRASGADQPRPGPARGRAPGAGSRSVEGSGARLRRRDSTCRESRAHPRGRVRHHGARRADRRPLPADRGAAGREGREPRQGHRTAHGVSRVPHHGHDERVPRRDPLTNQSVVAFTLTHRCGRIFGDATARHVGDYMAIILDGRVQGQPPVIKSEIRNEGQIELGSRPFADAQDLALVLRAGALPAPLTIVEERTISSSLGEDSINAGIRAGVVGIILVVLIMVGYYRLSGALAVAALALYTLLTFGGLAAFGFTLTMPGLAGFVLSVGIAVDANVLIFERIREELQHGKLVRTAVDEV